MIPIEDWTYDDFIAFLLIMGAKADLKFSEVERDAIISKVGEEQLKKMERCFDQQNDVQHIETVSELYARFSSKIGGKENLVKSLKEIIDADDRQEHVMDRYLMMMLKKIL